jgi:uroporphyrinogen-III synthase
VPDPLDLHGRTVGVTADRRGEDQVVMFGRHGAHVILGPTIATVKVPDPALLRRRTEEVVADPPDYLIANTGIGIRTWFAAAEEWGLGGQLLEALNRTTITSRGPKASGALSSAGLSPGWKSPTEQLGEVVDHLTAEGLSGRRVALQLHGDDGAEFVARLESAGAEVTTIPVYVWRAPEDPRPAMNLIDHTCSGDVHALTFTAGPQVRSMFDLASTAGREDELRDVLRSGDVVVGCIGPVCAAVALECGIPAPLTPENWRLGSLVRVVAEALSAPR